MSMFILGWTIGKKHHALMKVWARVFICNVNNNTNYMLQCGSLHSKSMLSHNFKQRKSGYWLTCFNFWGLMITEIDMVSSYNLYKVESLKAKRDALQSSDPAHPCKKGSITTITSPKHSCLNRKSLMSLGGTVHTIVLLTQMHFSKVTS